MKRILDNITKLTSKKIIQYEFQKIKNVVLKNYKRNDFLLVDIGSGLCKFAMNVAMYNKKENIYCIDVNRDLVNLAKKNNFVSTEGLITSLPYKNDFFDVVHCSHVIEHLTYPDIIYAINEMMRVVKKEGLVIIRSPLWANHRFYNDIDHVRPYPPEAILNYFCNTQQQSVGEYTIEEVDRWYTRVYYEIDEKRFSNIFCKCLNVVMKFFWLCMGFPFDRPNNYGLVIRKK